MTAKILADWSVNDSRGPKKGRTVSLLVSRTKCSRVSVLPCPGAAFEASAGLVSLLLVPGGGCLVGLFGLLGWVFVRFGLICIILIFECLCFTFACCVYLLEFWDIDITINCVGVFLFVLLDFVNLLFSCDSVWTGCHQVGGHRGEDLTSAPRRVRRGTFPVASHWGRPTYFSCLLQLLKT